MATGTRIVRCTRSPWGQALVTCARRTRTSLSLTWVESRPVSIRSNESPSYEARMSRTCLSETLPSDPATEILRTCRPRRGEKARAQTVRTMASATTAVVTTLRCRNRCRAA